MALAFAGISRAAYTPIAIQSSSYNADVIVESNATPALTVVTSASIDNGTNNTANTWFEQGYDLANPLNGLPPHGTSFVSQDNANFSFQMAPSYTAPNGILIDSSITTGTFTLVNPAAYTTLSFLGMGGNGGDQMTATVHHQDGTTETGSFGTPDWFGNNTGIAWIAGGRCNSTVNLTTETDGQNPRIYHREITLTDTASPVTNIVLTYVSGNGGSHSDVMAVSGALTGGSGAVVPITVTGYDYDFIVESNAPQNGRILSQTVVNGTNVWAATASLDGDTVTGNSWYEQGYNLNNDDSGSYNNPSDNLTGTGIPRAGTTFTSPDGSHTYKMPADYTVNNAIYISDLDTYTNATITLAAPAAYSGLSFLAAAGNGPVSVNYMITHQGGATETGVLVIQDWFSGSAPAAWVANGRVAVDTAQFSNVNGTNYPGWSPGYPRLLENDIVLSDTIDPVVSVYLENTNGVDQGLSSGRFSILAVSGSAGALPPNIVIQPASVNVYFGSSVTFTSTATANAPITYQWQVQTNGVFVNLSNGGNISGATNSILTINPAGFGNDQANYQMVASDVAGNAISATATLGVFSTNVDVTQPGDPITGVNFSPFGDGAVTFAIDNSMDTKLGGNISGGVVGLIISPSAGRTIVSGLRVYTGSDSTGRDPASYELLGSLDGGATYTMISSNALPLSNNRNPLVAGEAPNPLTQWVTEERFSNANGYTTYKILFPTEKGSGQLQFDEMELLGVTDSSKPFFSQQPTDAKAFSGNSASFTAVATFNPTPSVSWLRGTNGVYVALSDIPNYISGSQTTTLSINPATFADSADYIAVANSTAGYVTSSIAHLFIYSTNVDVTQNLDPITGFGDTSTIHGGATNANNAIDDTLVEWINGGSGQNNNGGGSGFPPFNGPVGLIVTPAVGSTVLAGLRVYSGQDSPDNDPDGFILEGSNNGGTNYSLIASGPLALPLERSNVGETVDPTAAPAQEILFSNSHGFTTYRLTFPNVVNSNNASYLEVGEIELLGVPGVGVAQPMFTHTAISGGSLHLSGTGGTPLGSFTVQTNANLTLPGGWNTAASGTYGGDGSFSISLPVSPTTPRLFYRIH
jgi:hypothetical protein